jgi:hypothetical protein
MPHEIKHLGRTHHSVVVWPHLDIDVVYTYDVDGNLSTVEITAFGKVKTITYTYTEGKLTGQTVVIT